MVTMVTQNENFNILLSTKGHPYERQPFYDVFDDMTNVTWTHIEQPASQALLTVEQAAAYDALVLYDMPGIAFSDDAPPVISSPSESFKQNFLALVEEGHGFVFLHHALAGWQDWDAYAEIMGGRFLYMPRQVRGQNYLDSGYRHDVTHQVKKLADHPVTAGIPDQFEITDELYLCEVFESDVTPLLVSDYVFQAENFYSASAAVCDGKMNDNTGWAHPEGSPLVGWTKEIARSRIVYLQFGDGPSAYSNQYFRRLLANAIKWVAQR